MVNRPWVRCGGAAAVLALAALARGSETFPFSDLVESAGHVLVGDRLALADHGSLDAVASTRHLLRAERVLRTLRLRVAEDRTLDSERLRLVGRVIREIELAVRAHGLAPDSASNQFAEMWATICLDDLSGLRERALGERDRLIDAAARARATKRLDRAAARLDAARREPELGRRVALSAGALRALERAEALTVRLAEREERARIAGGVVVRDGMLTFRGRGTATVTALSFDVTIETADGTFVARRVATLPDTAGPAALPVTLARGESFDAVAAMQVERGGACFVDGTITWHTSAGDVTAALHLRP